MIDSSAADTISDPHSTAAGQAAIRVGSPFAVDPELPPPLPRAVERVLDVGPMRYTVLGAVAASLMVIGFAVAAAWWFPAGGTLIAALGCGLSIFGLWSARRLVAATLLVAHLGLFMLCYMQSVGG